MVKDYEKACEKGNVVKSEKIANQIAEKYPDNAAEWTDELMERVMTASVTLMKNVEEDAMDALEDALEDVDIEDEEDEW
jgi:Mg/Co/Ni transporter MgtE